MTVDNVAEELPPLEQLPEIVGFDTGPFVGLNELIVVAGYHPEDYDRNSFRQWGGEYPPKGSPAWQVINRPWRMLRAHQEALLDIV